MSSRGTDLSIRLLPRPSPLVVLDRLDQVRRETVVAREAVDMHQSAPNAPPYASGYPESSPPPPERSGEDIHKGWRSG
eukprot:4862214-Amphidinium_carterae.1